MAFRTANTERMRIDSSGNVGIGVSPSYKLDVQGAAGDVAIFRGDANNTIRAYLGSSYQIFQAYNGTNTNQFGYVGDVFYIQTAATERMRIDSSGRLMVGTTSALAGNSKLSIVGEATAGQQQVTLHNPATSGTRYFMAFGTEASYTERGYIAYNGSSVFVGTVSDIKLKENIRDLDNGLSVISKIKPRVFDWKDGHEKNAVGFISQEIEEIKPDWVNEKDNIKFIESNLTSSIPYIIKAIQEQQEQIETLKAEVQELKDNG